MNRASAFLSLAMLSSPAHAVTFLYSHGIAHNKTQAYWYTKTSRQQGVEKTNKHPIIDTPLVTFNYPDATGPIANWCRVNFTQTSFGQSNELTAFDKAYAKATEQNDKNVIVVGLSRGAVVAWIHMALYKPDHTKLAILESCFDSLENVINNKFFNPILRRLAHFLIRYRLPFFKYNPQGLKPINVIDQIPLNTPLLLVCSEQDTTVPAECTLNLYNKLHARGHQHLYLLKLKNGTHSKLINGDDGHIYQNVVHALYKRYCLPHDSDCARNGEPLLKLCQPATA